MHRIAKISGRDFNRHVPLPGGNILFLMRLLLLAHLLASPLTAQRSSGQFNNKDMAANLEEALSYQKYPTYDQYLEMMQGFAVNYPEICRLDTIGYSTGGRLLLAVKISDHVESDEAEAAFLYSSTMHGNEIVGYVLLLRVIDMLLTGYGMDPEINRLVDTLQIWINPLANPDGAFSQNDGLSLELAVRTNLNGVDLNRDFPEATRGEADDTTGRELETRNMMLFHRDKEFILSANIHSGTEVVNYPWDARPARHADDNWYRFISREYADEAMAVDPLYMAGWPDVGITNGWDWYQALGTRQDYVNYYLGGREVTLELSEAYLLPAKELEHHWNVNQRSLLNYMSQCLYGIRGRVSDLENGEALRARIEIPAHDSPYSVVHSSAGHGDFYRLIKEGVYDLVVSAPDYLNDTIENVSVTDYQATTLDIKLKRSSLAVEPRETPAFRVYPNPAVHSFVLEPLNLPHGPLDITIHAMDGRMVYQGVLHYFGSPFELSTGGMDPGIYLLRCKSGKVFEVVRLMVLSQ